MAMDMNTKTKCRRAKVTFSYAAENTDELTLLPGQMVDMKAEEEEVNSGATFQSSSSGVDSQFSDFILPSPGSDPEASLDITTPPTPHDSPTPDDVGSPVTSPSPPVGSPANPSVFDSPINSPVGSPGGADPLSILEKMSPSSSLVSNAGVRRKREDYRRRLPWERVKKVVQAWSPFATEFQKKEYPRVPLAGHQGTDTLKQRLDQALKNRHMVNARITKVVFIGPAGSGKSHLLSALVGEDPGESRDSTPCAKRGIRAIARHRALVGKDSDWKLLKPDEFESMIVKMINENIAVTPALVDLSTSSAATTPRDFEELTEHLSERSTPTVSHSLDGTHWIILVDTGGQSRYHEVFRAFIRNAVLNLIVIKLTDDLDEVPSDEYYKDGQMICRFGTYNFTNQQLITRLLQTVQSSVNTTRVCSQIPKHPACFLVGTHKDKEDECNEPCAAKNKKLTEILQPYKNVIYPKRKARQPGRTEWIFPVNAKPPFTEDQKQLLQDLRDCIMQHSQEKSPTVPLALAWYALEIRMEMLRGEGKRVISLAQCRETAQALRFPSPDQTDEDDLLLALEYFDELGLLIYIPDVLPEVLFIDPQLLLDMTSELIASCCRLRADDGTYHLPYTCSAEETEEFTEWGVFTVPFLQKCFSTHYVEGLLTAQDFVDLLTYLLIAAPLDQTRTRYFMPCLLQSSTTPVQLSTTPNHTCFLVHLQMCPFGLFCAVVAYMLSSPAEPRLSFSIANVEHFSEHSVTFESDDYGCSITLVNNESSLCFEVYVDKANLDDRELSELCPALRARALQGVKEASMKHHYLVSSKDAFFCSSECSRKPVHAAHVVSGNRCMCSVTKKKFLLSKEQMYWLQAPPETQAQPSGRETQQYQSIFSRLDQIISHLSSNLAAESLADTLYSSLLITEDCHREVGVAGVTNYRKMRLLILAVLSKIELSVENYDTFVSILKSFQGLEDIVEFIVSD